MVAIEHSGGLRRASAWIAIVPGGVVAAAVAAMPSTRLDPIVAASGLSRAIVAASPPFGATARTLLALGTGGAAAALTMLAIFLTLRLRDAVGARRTVASDAPVLRRADAHPDAPSRRPIRASEDLGPPLPTVSAPPRRVHEQPLPADLDLPLAAFDPAAVPAVPAAPVRPVAPLATRRALIDPGERFETFALTPAVRPARGPGPVEPGSIGALLDRLERSTQRTQRRRVDVDQTLGMLRGLATG